MVEYKLNSMEVPRFYTQLAPIGTHADSFGHVFAETGDHFEPEWIKVGFVSKQTPFGQGTGLGFHRSELREATKAEVAVAIDRNHPHGQYFRPACQEAQNASFHLIFAGAIKNWTNDNPGSSRPINNFSRNDLKKIAEDALRRHRKLMTLWPLICWRQRKAIAKALA